MAQFRDLPRLQQDKVRDIAAKLGVSVSHAYQQLQLKALQRMKEKQATKRPQQ